MLNKLFALQARGTDVKTEVLAGITTFMTMAYILFINPNILGMAGMDKNAVLLATAIGAGTVTIAMGLLVNFPVAFAPGMGLNAFYAFTVVIGMGVPWQVALGSVFISGLVFLLLTLTNLRQMIIEVIPSSVKYAISVGIGLFITLVGLKLSGLLTIRLDLIPPTLEKVVATNGKFVPLSFETIMEMGKLSSPDITITLIGIVITAVLMARKVNGAILFGILLTALVAIFMGAVKVPPAFSPFAVPDFSNNAFMALDIRGALNMGLFTIIFTFTFVELFDAMGTLIGTTSKAGLMQKDGKIPGIGKALLVDSTGISLGAMLGTSSITAYVESSAGIGAGGRTGLTAVTCGILFYISLFITPLVALIPAAATYPALIIVGCLMMEGVKHIDFSDFTEALPAFLTIVLMPFTYSIANGVSAGLIAYPLLKVITGQGKKVHWLLYVLAIVVIARYVFVNE